MLLGRAREERGQQAGGWRGEPPRFSVFSGVRALDSVHVVVSKAGVGLETSLVGPRDQALLPVVLAGGFRLESVPVCPAFPAAVVGGWFHRGDCRDRWTRPGKSDGAGAPGLGQEPKEPGVSRVELPSWSWSSRGDPGRPSQSRGGAAPPRPLPGLSLFCRPRPLRRPGRPLCREPGTSFPYGRKWAETRLAELIPEMPTARAGAEPSETRELRELSQGSTLPRASRGSEGIRRAPHSWSEAPDLRTAGSLALSPRARRACLDPQHSSRAPAHFLSRLIKTQLPEPGLQLSLRVLWPSPPWSLRD